MIHLNFTAFDHIFDFLCIFYYFGNFVIGDFVVGAIEMNSLEVAGLTKNSYSI